MLMLNFLQLKMTRKYSEAYVRCFWAGKMQLLNGHYLLLYCTHISNKEVEVEISRALVGYPKVMLELNATHEGRRRHIKAICSTVSAVLNKHNKYYIKLHFESISQKDIDFIENFVIAHA